MQNQLIVNNISKKVKNKEILKNVTLEIEGIYGILGKNGAGKSTLMRILSLFSRPSGGELYLLTESEIITDYRSSIGYLPQSLKLFPKYTLKETLNYLSLLNKIPRKKRNNHINELMEQLNLTKYNDTYIENLSGGVLRRAGLAQALINDPKILIIDEPSAGLDIEEQIRLRNVLKTLAREKTIIISSHNADDIDFLCNKVCILDSGTVVTEGYTKDIRNKANNLVWEVEVKGDKINNFLDENTVISTKKINNEDFICKVHSSEKPLDGVEINPSLEDGFLVAKKNYLVKKNA